MRLALQRGYVGPGTCPSASEPLLKTIAAVSGDVVRVTDAGIVVNGELLPHSTALAHDGRGGARSIRCRLAYTRSSAGRYG
jgi:type IV secretory pathway protease TraF